MCGHRYQMGMWGGLLGAGLLALAAGWSPASGRAEEQPETLAEHAKTIFARSCAKSGCHDNLSKKVGLDLTRRDSAIDRKFVVVKDAANSELFKQVNSGEMPLGGQKLADADIATLKSWIEAGAPDWNAPKAKPANSAGAGQIQERKPVVEATLLKAIVRDLEAANERDRSYLRYYSLANLYNNPDLTDADLNLYRTALTKLTNSLSWSPDIVQAKLIDPTRTLVRIDLRDFDWTPAIWQRMIAAYPYGLRTRNLGGELDQIRALSGAQLPYIRVDWFVANASLPPLYNEILQLPDNVPDLEKKLGVDAERDIAQEKAVRGGLRNSGVSRNNRAVERHRSLYGAYWKSFDFADNAGVHNIFKNPLDMQPSGGEFIFHLPNGLQGYFLANGQGKKLDDGPINIVRDHDSNPDDPIVHNGRSCIGCHYKGMNSFHDEVRDILETHGKVDFDIEKAEALYVPQKDLDRLFEQDSAKFQDAVRKTGGDVPKSVHEEPINMLSQRYVADVSVQQAAADAGLSVEELQKRVGRSSALDNLGFGTLQGKSGGMKRDVWEEYFGQMAEEIRLGDVLKPTQFRLAQAAPAADKRPTISIGALTAPDPELARQARQALTFWLRQSDDVRVVSENADYTLKGTLLVKSRDEVTVTVGDPRRSVLEAVTGTGSDMHFLTQQLANRVNFRVTGNWLPAQPAGAATAIAAIPADPIQKLQQAGGKQGAVGVSLSVDCGPGATYNFGEEVQVRFKVDKDCFLTLYDIDSQGNVSILFPNEFAADNKVQAGQVYALPDPKDGWKIEVGGIPGLETVVAIATLNDTDLPGLAEFRKDPKGKSLGVARRGAHAFAQDVGDTVKASAGAAGATISSVRFFTVK